MARHLSAHECGKCGYDLTGLDKWGQCPECGQEFDTVRQRGVRRRRTPEERRTRMAHIILTSVLAGLTGLSLVLAVVCMIVGTKRPVPLLALLAVVLSLCAAWSWAYHKARDELER